MEDLRYTSSCTHIWSASTIKIRFPKILISLMKIKREVFLQLKWFKGSPGVNGDLIIKVVSIKPRGGNAITLAVDELLKCKDAVKWGLNKVVMESILDRELFEKLKLRGWVERPGIYNNLYRYAPHYREPTLEDILKMRGMRS